MVAVGALLAVVVLGLLVAVLKPEGLWLMMGWNVAEESEVTLPESESAYVSPEDPGRYFLQQP
jgi:hypothetical protein